MSTVDDFRRIALSLPGTEESAHMGAADFRVDGRIFATLAHAGQGFGNLMLTPEAQSELIADAPELFLPVAGGWGRMGATHVRLAAADDVQLHNALKIAHGLRSAKNTRPAARRKPSKQ